MKEPVLSAEFIAASTSLLNMPPPLYAEVAFAGRSNVGKSSLINSLVVRRNLARTSSRPGHTRTLNFYRVQTIQGTMDFVDLPGYGYAKRSKTERQAWAEVMRDFMFTRSSLRAVALVVDIRREMQAEEQQILSHCHRHQKNLVLIATKMDKLAPSRQSAALTAIQKKTKVQVFGYSAVTAVGRLNLWNALLTAAGLESRKVEVPSESKS